MILLNWDAIIIVTNFNERILDHNNKIYDIILHNNFIASPPVTPPPLPPVRVQVLCSVVVWYSPEVSCEGTIHGYEVQFYDPNVIQSNTTRYVGANRTFYGITEEDRLAGENTYVQVTNNILALPHHVLISQVYMFSHVNRFESYTAV